MCSTATAAVEEVLGMAGGADREILGLVELIAQAEAALVERVGAFDAAEGWAADGAYSFACWLRARSDLSRAESSQLGRFARLLRMMPVTEQALRDGKISVAKARVLAGVINERTEQSFLEQEQFLVEQVAGLSVDDTKEAMRYWKRLADQSGPDPSDPAGNWARLSHGFGGRYHLEGNFDQVSGAILKATLDAITDKMHQDGRFADLSGSENTASRRYADALMEMCNRSTGRNPNQPAVNPEIIIVVPLHALTDDQPDPFDPPTVIDGGHVALRDVLRFMLIGAGVSPLIVDDCGRPLNLGRRRRLRTRDQWIAGTVRDRGCVVPGCDRPAAWTRFHHQKWWKRDHGPTDMVNLPSACSHHHHLIHDKGWDIQPLPDGTWQFIRPDGTVVERPRYPGNGPPPRRPRRPKQPG